MGTPRAAHAACALLPSQAVEYPASVRLAPRTYAKGAPLTEQEVVLARALRAPFGAVELDRIRASGEFSDRTS